MRMLLNDSRIRSARPADTPKKLFEGDGLFLFICHVRMKRSGAWWYGINGNTMLRLYCAFYNETFDEVFARYKRLRKSS
jgi:hypothetical protein